MIHARADYNRIQDPEGLIPEDEPVFLIRGQDVTGAAAVQHWAGLAELEGASPEIVALARAHALRMNYWNRHKVPDLSEPKGASK